MPKISKLKEEKIKETILAFLFQNSPQSLFTYHIAQELARDEEFVKRLLQELETKELILSVKKNPQGNDYTKRIRWRLSEKAYNAYKNLNGNQQIQRPQPLIPLTLIGEEKEEAK